MKYLKYALGIIVVLLLIFFIRGLLTPSIYYEREITVNKPVEETWAVMQDESKLHEWITGYKKTEHVSGTPGEVGAVSRIYVEDNGQEMVMEETITAFTPNEQMSMKFSMDFMVMDYTMHLEENDGKTTIKSSSTTKGNGLFAKSLISFMSGSMKAQEIENMNKLKNVIESNTKNYFPEPEPVENSEEEEMSEETES